MQCTLCGGDARRLSVIYEGAKETLTTVTNTQVTEKKGHGYQQKVEESSRTEKKTDVTYKEEGLKAAPPARVAFHAYSFNGGGAFSREFGKIFKHPIFMVFFCILLALVLVGYLSSAIINSEIDGLGSIVYVIINGLLTGLFLTLFPVWLIAFVRSRPEANRNNAIFKAKYDIAFAEHEKKQDEIYLNWKNSWKCQACGEVFIHYL